MVVIYKRHLLFQEALVLGKEDESRLIRNRRLVLLVDLDQTLIHTTNENIAPNIKDVYHFQVPRFLPTSILHFVKLGSCCFEK